MANKKDELKARLMETFRVEEGSALAGRSLADAALRAKTGATVLAAQLKDGVYPNPSPETQLSAGDLVLLLGTPEQLAQAAWLFRK